MNKGNQFGARPTKKKGYGIETIQGHFEMSKIKAAHFLLKTRWLTYIHYICISSRIHQCVICVRILFTMQIVMRTVRTKFHALEQKNRMQKKRNQTKNKKSE